MGPETIVGQLRQDYTKAEIEEKIAKGSSFAAAWEGKFGANEYEFVMAQDRAHDIIIDWENGETDVMSGAQAYELIFDSGKPWMLSANGTIFTYEKEGIIPGLLKRWYAERKELQAKLKEAIKAENKIEEEYWDKRQLVKKINLNSLYGAILNPGCRFFDKRIGQSTTLTGRTIARHMDAYINECITGIYDHTGEAIIYGDTDSCYFSAYPMVKADVLAGKMEWNKDIAVGLYDSIADQVNESFPAFCERAFHTPRRQGELIRGGRESVSLKGLFIKKKRYAILIYDMEGHRLDTHGTPGKVKAMGLDLKRSDTPKVIQDFLSDVLLSVLTGADRDTIITKVRDFKLLFTERPAWEKGTPKRVNNLTKYTKEEERLGKANMPGHVRAAMNWNNLKRMMGDQYSMSIVDGMKTVVCKLKENPLGYSSVGYPTDETHIPAWFKELPFDDASMETGIVDQKVENLLGVLKWQIAENTQIATTFDNLFSFE
jgi:DNA polymerase elongation subunit (family B)